MSALNQALDAHRGGSGSVEVGDASVEVDAVGPIGVRVRRVEVRRAGGREVAEEAARLPGALRSLGERVVPTEVDPGLGGAILRTAPEEMRGGEFYEVEVQADGRAGVSRRRVGSDGQRRAVGWDITRKQLGRLIDELG